MTLIVGIVTDRFALVVSDTLARVDGMGMLKVGETVSIVRDTAVDVQKLHETRGHGMIGTAGNHYRHAQYLDEALEMTGFDCDEFVFSRLSILPRFRDLHVIPPMERAVQEVLHVYRAGTRFIMTRMEGSILHIARAAVRDSPKRATVRYIGSGAARTAELLAGPLASTWEALAHRPDARPEDFLAFFRPVFVDVSAAGEVSPDVVAWSMGADHRWELMTEPRELGSWIVPR